MAAIKGKTTDPKHCTSLAFFKGLTLFAELPEADVIRFADTAQVKSYKKGQNLYLEGHRAEHFYVICTGWIKLFRTTEEGEEVNLAMITSNSTTGETATDP